MLFAPCPLFPLLVLLPFFVSFGISFVSFVNPICDGFASTRTDLSAVPTGATTINANATTEIE